METLINYSDSTTPNIEGVIDNLTKIDQNTKENLKEISEIFFSQIHDLDISNLQAYPIDSNSVGLVFMIKHLDFRIEFFYSSNGNSEYIASMKSGKNLLFYKKGTRSDFNEFRTILENEIMYSRLENGVKNRYYGSGQFINLRLKN